jgi:Bacterial membrane protein YfhO
MLFRKLIPYLIALAIFIGITFVFFQPLFSGNVLKQQDIIQHRMLAHETVEYREKFGKEPLWNSSMYSGMPTTPIGTIYPGNGMSYVDDLLHLYLPTPARFLFLAFVGFFVLLLSLKIDPWVSLIGAIAFGLSSHLLLIGLAGHNSKSNAIDYLPFIFAGIIWLFTERRWLGFSVLSLALALELNANHLQITYYGILISLMIFIAYSIPLLREKKFRSILIPIGISLLAVFFAILPNTANLTMTQEYARESNRSQTELTIQSNGKSNAGDQTGGVTKSYAYEWSMPADEAFTFLIPNYKGGASIPVKETEHADVNAADANIRNLVEDLTAYFGGLPRVNGPFYPGIIIVFLACISLFAVQHRLRWGIVAMIVFAYLLALGDHFESFNNLMYSILPGYNKFRSVSMSLVIIQILLPVLAAVLLHQLYLMKWPEEVRKRFSKITRITLIVFGSFFILNLIAPSLLNRFEQIGEQERFQNLLQINGSSEQDALQKSNMLIDILAETRQGLVRGDAMRSLLLILSVFALVFVYLKGKIKAPIFLAATGFLILADLYLVDNRYFTDKQYERKELAFKLPDPSPVDKYILEDTSLYRVANGMVENLFADASTSAMHHSIGGYNAAKLTKYEDLIQFHLNPELYDFVKGIDSVKKNDSLLDIYMAKYTVLNMLNTKYFILDNGKKGAVINNELANGNAWFVKNIIRVNSADSEIVRLKSFSSKDDALIRTSNDKRTNARASYSGFGTIRLTKHLPNELSYQTESDQDQFAVFSEIYYPNGWNASIDGKKANHICVDYLLRGMEIPAGKHTVIFRYEPETYSRGNSISLIGSILVLFIFVGGLFFQLLILRKEIRITR